MPIDPRIPLMGQPAPIQNPLQAIGQIAELQGLREQTEVRRLAAEEARRNAADEAAIRRVLTETGGDMEQALPRLRMIAPQAALTFETEIAKQQKEAFEALTKKVDLSSKQLELGSRLLESVTDQPTYDLVRPMIATMAPDIAQMMGDVYDPARVQQFRAVGLTQKEKYDRQQDALKLMAEGKASEAIGTWLSTIDPKMPDAAEQWNAVLAGAQTMGVPAAVLAPFGSYSPENVARAAQLAITPTKRAELAGQAEGRAQTAAHQQVLEGQGAERVAIARERAAQAGAGGEGGAVKLSAAQQEDIATMLTVEQLAKDVQQIGAVAGGFPGVGPIPGRLPASALGIGGTTGEQLRNALGNIQGTIAKLRGGTSFTPSEQALLDTYTPTTKDTDAAIRTKLTSLIDFIQKKRANTLRVAAGQYTLPETSRGEHATSKTNPFRR